MRKIVAIGGGENGHIRSNGTYTTYETKNIDKEIVALTGKENPNFLLIAIRMLTVLGRIQSLSRRRVAYRLVRGKVCSVSDL